MTYIEQIPDNPYHAELVEYVEKLGERREVPKEQVSIKFTPTPLLISTMTALAHMNSYVNRDAIYDAYQAPTQEAPVGHEGVDLTRPIIIQGFCLDRDRFKGFGRAPAKANFMNSATLFVNYREVKIVNVKLFLNGRLQMTGVSCIEMAGEIAEFIHNWVGSIAGAFVDAEEHRVTGLETVLINTNYSFGFNISRERLDDVLTNKYGLCSQFETDGYPGVKFRYFWNRQTVHTAKEGMCHCANRRCSGKDTGEEEGHCKKITLAIFTSGNTIVTGGRNMEQVRDAYDFLNRIVSDNYDAIRASS
jgi:TATA-box binding protein (TBP) (component of TFIID and TFIIIB)